MPNLAMFWRTRDSTYQSGKRCDIQRAGETAPGHFSYQDQPDPEVGAHDVLIRVQSCGICGTDLHIHEGEFMAQFPLIPGHEFAGEVVATGSAVTNVRVGDRVVCDNTELCGHCFFCRRDQPLFCENFLSHGVNSAGGQAEYVAIKAEKVFPIHNLSWEEATKATDHHRLLCANT